MTATEKKVTKISQSREIFNRVYTAGFVLNGKSQRGAFIDLCKEELGISKHCAGTYFQNLTNEAKGQPLYKYNKVKPKTAKEVAGLEGQLAQTTAEVNHRWMAVNAEGTEIASFGTRSEAQKHAKENGLEWRDRTKAA